MHCSWPRSCTHGQIRIRIHNRLAFQFAADSHLFAQIKQCVISAHYWCSAAVCCCRTKARVSVRLCTLKGGDIWCSQWSPCRAKMFAAPRLQKPSKQGPAVTFAALIHKEMTPTTHVYMSTAPIIVSRRKHSRLEFEESEGHIHLVPR
jgi:hypothetical protein